MAKRSIRITLNEQASENLRQIADELGISETEVMRRGLNVMSLYASIKKDKSGALIIEQGDKQRELLLV